MQHHDHEHTADHSHPGQHTGHQHAFDSPEMAQYAELEGEVLIGLVTEAVSVLAAVCDVEGGKVARVLDLGSGPGVGTCCLAQRFDSATVIAIDGSPIMLEHAASRATRFGLGQRVRTQRAEFPADLSTLERADVVWASMVIHHVGDETAALGQIRSLLEPGGVLAVVERAGVLRTLPEDADFGRPGIWERLDVAWATWFANMRAELPEVKQSRDYAAMLTAAGFDVLEDRVLTLELDPPLEDRTRGFARQQLLRTQRQLEGLADLADLQALDVLIDEAAEDGIMRRADALLRASRRLCVARPARSR